MDTIEVHMAVEMEETLIIKIEEPAVVKGNRTFNIIEGENKIIHFEGVEDNGMEMTLITGTEIIGIEILKVKVILTGAEDGIIVEVRDIVIREEGEDGILISNTTIQGTNNTPNLQTRIIIVHHPWVISTDTQSHMSNTHIPSNNNTSRKCHQLHHNKRQIFVNCVRIRAIMITNANLQVILWPAHKKPSTRATHIATKILITGSGHMATLITMTLMGNLFSSRGSQCPGPPLRTLNVFYQGTNVEMLEETYLKFKKNILPKMKKMQRNFQEPVVEYCEPDQVIDICSYNHYPVLDKTNETQEQHNDDNDIYGTSELEHEFEYGIYEDVFKTEQLMAELKRIDEAEQENKQLRDLEFKDFPLEQFSDGGRVANEGDPHLKAAADTELYDLEKHAIQIDIDKHKYQKSSYNTDDNSSPCADNNASQTADGNSSQCADDYIQPTKVSHVQSPTVGEKYHVEHDDNTLRKMVYGPTYVPYNKDGQKLLLPQTTDMSRKDNLKPLYNSLPEGMCDNEYESLEQPINDIETFQYSHETSTKHVLVQGVYVGSASPLIADIKTQPYSVLTYMDDGMMTGTYDNTHDIPIYVDNGSTLNIMPTHFYDKAYYLHHLPKALTAAETIHTGNGPVKTHFWIDILLNVQGCMIQFKLLVCDMQAQTGILLSKMALEQLQTWQDYSINTLYVKQTAIPLHAIQNIELLPDRKNTIEVIADRTNELQYKELIDGQGII